MTGDNTISPSGSYSLNAGIIPRTLYHLFNSAEEEGFDFAVKCSFIELYNEDLRDLLSDQSKKITILDSSHSNEPQNSKRYKDMTKGQENVFIESARQGIEVLQSGLDKRQVASTKMNDTSSRSHTIFSITVYITMNKGRKSPTPNSDALPNENRISSTVSNACVVGKINLVDLAGSENIGKSGAENKRAREAGLINKSLLSLGRVINGLVSKSPHIPYRESMLTRLLQDSLGGHTRTCIIATISPAQINVEETLSTLEYASKAKNIKNKPQAGSLVSKSDLLKEWSDNFIRMKKDLDATRKKNGIYLTEEQFNQNKAENYDLKLQNEELRRKITQLENQVKSNSEMLESTKLQYITAKRQLSESQVQLESCQSQLQTEIALKETHFRKEKELEQINQELRALVNEKSRDISRLQSKLLTKKEHDEINRQNLQSYTAKISDTYTALETIFTTNCQTSNKELDNLKNSFSDFFSAQSFKLRTIIEGIKRTDAETKDLVSQLASSEEQKTHRQKIKAEIENVRELFKSQIQTGLQDLERFSAQLVSQVHEKIQQFDSLTNDHSRRLRVDVYEFFKNINEITNTQNDQILSLNEQLRTLQKNLTDNMNKALTVDLSQAIAEEKKAAKTERENLLKTFEAMLMKEEKRREENLLSKIHGISSSTMSTSTELVSKQNNVQKMIASTVAEGKDKLGKVIEKSTIQLDSLVDSLSTSHAKSGQELKTNADMASNDIQSTIKVQSSKVTEELSRIDAFSSKVDKSYEAEYNSLQNATKHLYELSRRSKSEMEKELSAILAGSSDENSEPLKLLDASISKWKQFNEESTFKLCEFKNTFFSGIQYTTDPTTGTTPAKALDEQENVPPQAFRRSIEANERPKPPAIPPSPIHNFKSSAYSIIANALLADSPTHLSTIPSPSSPEHQESLLSLANHNPAPTEVSTIVQIDSPAQRAPLSVLNEEALNESSLTDHSRSSSNSNLVKSSKIPLRPYQLKTKNGTSNVGLDVNNSMITKRKRIPLDNSHDKSKIKMARTERN